MNIVEIKDRKQSIITVLLQIWESSVKATHLFLTEKEIKELRDKYDIHAAFKMVDTCAAEFEATTPYYYSVFGSENEAVKTVLMAMDNEINYFDLAVS